MSYFSQPRSERDIKTRSSLTSDARIDSTALSSKPVQEIISTIGPGMLISGNLVCTGTMQIFGRVVGDIHAAKLIIREGAYVRGKILAQEATIDGAFKGTIHGNIVRLQATAVVEGEIHNGSLIIEQDAQFEGMARRLERAIEAPTDLQIPEEAPEAAPEPAASAPIAEVVPISEAVGQSYASLGRTDWAS